MGFFCEGARTKCANVVYIYISEPVSFTVESQGSEFPGAGSEANRDIEIDLPYRLVGVPRVVRGAPSKVFG